MIKTKVQKIKNNICRLIKSHIKFLQSKICIFNQVRSNQPFWRGHKVEGVWVFGALKRETGRVFMQTVEKRDAQTLIPLLEKWVLPKTTDK